MNRRIVFDDESRKLLKNGVDALNNAVKVTLGPKGRTVVLKRDLYSLPHVTKDGVTVAKEVYLEDPIEDIGAQMLKEVAIKTVNDAGDGPQDLNSGILTPNGWTTMGEIKKGDDVCGTNGSIQKVLEVYPKGDRHLYEVSFSGGTKVRCCKDHLWSVTTSYGVEKTLPLKDLMNDYVKETDDGNDSFKYYIPVSHVDFNEDVDKMPLDPYFLGVLLGDGSLSASGTTGIELSIGRDKEHILNKIILPINIELRSTWVDSKNYFRVKFTGINIKGKSILKGLLKSIGLLGVVSKTKFIPQSYLYSSLASRKALLQGLTDTDGHINDRGLFEFSTVSNQLAEDFANLCRGLGTQISVRLKNREGKGGYSETPVHVVSERKGYKYGNKLIDIKSLNRVEETRCIRVSNEDNLYITDGYVLTHNTTTATVLAQAILEQGLEHLSKEGNPVMINKGIEKATAAIVEKIKGMSIPINSKEELIEVATVSSNNDEEIGKIVGESMFEVGEDGIVIAEESEDSTTTFEIVKGMQVGKGLFNPYFINDFGRNRCVLDNPLVMIVDEKISKWNEIAFVVSHCVNANRSLLIICNDMEGEALQTCITNTQGGKISMAVVLSPGWGQHKKQMLQDLAVMTGTVVCSESNAILPANVTVDMLGECGKVESSKNLTVIVDGMGEKSLIEARIKNIKDNIENTQDVEERAQFKERLAKLNGGVGIIKIGAKTGLALNEKKDRIEDSLSATMAAREEGIVSGGGVALIRCISVLDKLEGANKDENTGIEIVKKAIEMPLKTILENAGLHVENKGFWRRLWNKLFGKKTSIFDKVMNGTQNSGYDAKEEKFVDDMIKAGIVDPAKVTRCATENAASIAGLILTTECVICHVEPVKQ